MFKWICFTCYLMIGAVVHLVTIGITFNPVSLMSWLVLFGWPAFVAAIALAVFLAYLLIMIAGGFLDHIWSRAKIRYARFRS